MTAPVIDQVFFGYSLDSSEHTIIAASLPDDRSAEMWRSRLQDHARLSGSEPPAEALSYLVFNDGSAAIICRFLKGITEGRTNAHVLIGPAEYLDDSLALRMAGWPGWRSTVESGWWPEPLAHSHLVDAVQADSRLRSEAARLERDLVIVVARLLKCPDRPLSVIGCPDKSRLAMVWALREALRDKLNWRWSFSTYETRHASSVPNLPQVIFLPAIPDDGEVARRTIVDLTKEPPTNQFTGEARELVAGLLRGTPVAHVSHHERQSAEPTVQIRLDQAPLGSAPESPPSMPTRPASHQATRKSRTWAESLLAMPSIDVLLNQLNRDSNREARHELRQALDVRAVDTLMEFVEFDAKQELLDKLLSAVYGPECVDLDHPDVQPHAMSLVRKGQSEYLSRRLAGYAIERKRDDIAHAAYERWTADAKLRRPGRPTLAMRQIRRNSYFPVIATVALLAVLMTAFLLGLLVGQPEPSVAQQAQAPVTGTAGPPTLPPVAARPAGVVNVVALDQGQELYSFVKISDRYFPQAKCVSQNPVNTAFKCEKTHNPPDQSGVQPELVAVAVPQAQIGDLDNRSATNRLVGTRKDWGAEYLVAKL